jgi:Golgi SNAP receptor complex protein 1
MATYDVLHRQCRTLESLFDTKLTAYSRLASAISQPQTDVEANGSGNRWKDAEIEIEDLLQKACGGGFSPSRTLPNRETIS